MSAVEIARFRGLGLNILSQGCRIVSRLGWKYFGIFEFGDNKSSWDFSFIVFKVFFKSISEIETQVQRYTFPLCLEN